jgi:hypothetical protein
MLHLRAELVSADIAERTGVAIIAADTLLQLADTMEATNSQHQAILDHNVTVVTQMREMANDGRERLVEGRSVRRPTKRLIIFSRRA